MGAMEGEDSGPSLQIRLKAGVQDEALRAADGVELSVPQKMGKKGLRQLLINLLELSEDTAPEFYFLVSDEHLLRTTLGKYVLRRNLSTEATLEITYYISLPTPEAQEPQPVSDEWLSAIHVTSCAAHADPLILTGSYSGAPSIVTRTDCLIGESSLKSSAHSAVIKGVAWVEAGASFLTASQDQTVQLWSCDVGKATAEPMSIFRSDESGSAVCFSCMSTAKVSSGETAAALGGMDGSIWTIASLEAQATESSGKKRKETEATRLKCERIGTASVNMSVSATKFKGDNIVSAGWDGLIRVWDTQKQTALMTIPCGGKAVSSVNVSESVMLVTAVDGAVRLIDAREGRGVVAACGRQSAHRGVVSDGCWIDVGATAVSGGLDGCLKFWDTRALVAAVRVVENVHGQAGKCVAVDSAWHDGRHWAFSAGADGKVAAVRL